MALPAGTAAEIRGTKPDGNGFSYAATLSGTLVTAVVTEQIVKPKITGNYAGNGAAIFVNSRSATFTGGVVTGNRVNGSGTIATGGAVGVGGTNARLYFSGAAQVTGNTFGTGNNTFTCNVYLDQDTDAIINTSGLADDEGKVGIYVPDKVKDGEEYLYKNRGGVGGVFGVYTENEAAVTGFCNDRWDKLHALRDETNRKIFWTAPINVEVRYLSSFNAFPTGTNGDIKLNPMEYYPTGEEMAFSAIAEELRGKCTNAFYAGMRQLRVLIRIEEFTDGGTTALQRFHAGKLRRKPVLARRHDPAIGSADRFSHSISR